MPVNKRSLEKAARIIKSGGVVAFPTETVYGLGADARDTAAVNAIFNIKGRPNDNPLIVHVHRDYNISLLVQDIPWYAEVLAKRFLPGPLTMVYKSKGNVSPAVSCGLDTLAIRVPSHPDAQEFLRYLDIPIAAPSANISKHVSATAAEQVFADLNGKIELILDGGACSGGIESTVLDCTGEVPVVLRSGLISREMIEKTVGACGEYIYKGGVARSPGMKYKHYAPYCKTALFELENIKEALDFYDSENEKGVNTVILCEKSVLPLINDKNYLCLGTTPEEMAANLYTCLREAEEYDLVIAIAPEERDGIMEGVMNRLTKACRS